MGTFQVNISVSDGTDEDWEIFTFQVANANDDPIMMRVGTVSVVDNVAMLTGTAGAIEDEEFTFTVEAIDFDLDIMSSNDALTFHITSNDVVVTGMAYGTNMYNVSFTPDNDDALKRYVMVNITVKDRTGLVADDYVMVTIEVANAPDAPEIIWVGVFAPPTNNSEPIDMSGTVITAGESMNVTINTEDMDGDTLYIESNLTALTTFTPIVNETNNWTMTFSPTDDEIGTVYLKVTISDAIFAGLEDFAVLNFEVEAGALPNNAPTMTVITASGQTIDLGGSITINGTWEDIDGDDVDILVSMKGPGDENFSAFSVDFDMTVNDDGTWVYEMDTSFVKSTYEALISALQAAKDLGLSGDDLKAAEEATADFIASYTGTWSFMFKAEDDRVDSLQSSPTNTITAIVEFGDSDGDNLPDDWELTNFGGLNHDDNDDYDRDGLTNLEEHKYGTDPTNKDTDSDGFNDKEEVEAGTDPMNSSDHPSKSIDEGDDGFGSSIFTTVWILMLIIIVAIVLTIVMIMRRSKQRVAASAYYAHQSQQVGPQEIAPHPELIPCYYCGAQIYTDEQICPRCGEPVQPPEHTDYPPPPPPGDIAQSEIVTCPACGVEQPPGAFYCKSCGRPVPATLPESTDAESTNACQVCGTNLPTNALYCPSCGRSVDTKIIEATAPTEPFESTAQQMPQTGIDDTQLPTTPGGVPMLPEAQEYESIPTPHEDIPQPQPRVQELVAEPDGSPVALHFPCTTCGAPVTQDMAMCPSCQTTLN